MTIKKNNPARNIEVLEPDIDAIQQMINFLQDTGLLKMVNNKQQ